PQSGTGFNRQYWRWRCTLTGRRLLDRRFRQCCNWQFFQSSQLGKRDGVNVNVIHPGATEPERFYQLLEQRSKASGKSVEQWKQETTAKDGLRRLGEPADISALVLFLCSEKARHIQGTAIAVDGGSTVGYYLASTRDNPYSLM